MSEIGLSIRTINGAGRFVSFISRLKGGAGQQAATLIEGLPAEVVMADTAYDADHTRQVIAAKGAFANLAVVTLAAIVLWMR
jgi:ABC-type sulfate transport system substrate-binding protein